MTRILADLPDDDLQMARRSAPPSRASRARRCCARRCRATWRSRAIEGSAGSSRISACGIVTASRSIEWLRSRRRHGRGRGTTITRRCERIPDLFDAEDDRSAIIWHDRGKPSRSGATPRERLQFDTNIVIDALARSSDRRWAEIAARRRAPWISRMAWIEVLSKACRTASARDRGISAPVRRSTKSTTRSRVARPRIRRERRALKSPDAIILASAQMRGRILVTRNTKDFPASMPGIRIPYTF